MKGSKDGESIPALTVDRVGVTCRAAFLVACRLCRFKESAAFGVPILALRLLAIERIARGRVGCADGFAAADLLPTP